MALLAVSVMTSCEGATTKEIAVHFQRKPSAITSRIKKLELVEKYGER